MTRFRICGLFWPTALLLLPVTLAACGPATYGTGTAPEMALFAEVTGGVLDRNKPKEPIDYNPRAPLVLPPGNAAQLPRPVESGAMAAPDWPVDREQLKAEADARADDGDPRNDINQAEYRRLKPLQGVFPDQRRPQDEISVAEDDGKSDYYNTIVHGKAKREQFAKAVSDPKGYGQTERVYLTDPPNVYREPDPAAPAGTEAVATEGNILTRWWRRK